MPFASLRRYDVQAMYACVLSLLSVVPFLAAAALVARNYHPELGQIVYGSKSSFLLLFLSCVLQSARVVSFQALEGLVVSKYFHRVVFSH